MKYSIPYLFVIFIANDWSLELLKSFGIGEITELSLKILCISINSIPSLMNGIVIK